MKSSPFRCLLTTELSGEPRWLCRGQTRPTMPHGPLERVVRRHSPHLDSMATAIAYDYDGCDAHNNLERPFGWRDLRRSLLFGGLARSDISNCGKRVLLRSILAGLV